MVQGALASVQGNTTCICNLQRFFHLLRILLYSFPACSCFDLLLRCSQTAGAVGHRSVHERISTGQREGTSGAAEPRGGARKILGEEKHFRMLTLEDFELFCVSLFCLAINGQVLNAGWSDPH